MCSSLTCLWPHEAVNTPHECGYAACASLSGAQAARGSYRGIVGTRQGALFPLCLPGADFHPRWAGGRLHSLLVWHLLDDLGGRDGRHTAIHGHVTGNRKAVLLQICSSELWIFPPLSLIKRKHGIIQATARK